MNFEENLNKIWQNAERDFNNANDLKLLEELKIKYLGRKSYLGNFSSLIKNLEIEEKRRIGKLYNDLKDRIQKLYLEKKENLDQQQIRFDFDHPGKEIIIGHKHLISQTFDQIVKIFTRLGFSIFDGNQIVSEKENFDFLNIHKNHPARDMWDTLWVKNLNNYLFRTHTSFFQVPTLRQYSVPLKAIIFGKVFRYEATDRTHDFEFYQLDGISVSQNTNLGHLKWVVEKFFNEFFNQNIKIRFRPSYFPFVEPGLEVDISCILCGQKGCPVCKFSGFIEVAGAGMIHNYVLKSAKIDFKKYQGYAFGFGVDRLIMIKHNINDIRILHSSDLRFINQF